MNTTQQCIETIDRTGNLYEVNVNEAWRKLTSRQFASDPVRGVEEIISNAVDSYPDDISPQNRKIAIDYAESGLSVTDWGGGMSLARIDCLLTMGGTDKTFDDKKIGQFGIGFCAIFNPALGTREVTVTTRCEGRGVELRFIVTNPDKPPAIEYRMLARPPAFATRIGIRFESADTVRSCRQWLENRFEFYPYHLVVNKKRVCSIWDPAQGVHHFTTEHTRGRLVPSPYAYVRVLCKYCHVASSTIDFLQRPSGMYANLDDYDDFPWAPGYGVDINCDSLSVVLSRNSFYIDSAFRTMMRELAVVLKGRLLSTLANRAVYDSETTRIVITNQYIFRSKLNGLVKAAQAGEYTRDPACLEHELFEAKIYAIDGKQGLFSLHDIACLKSADLPLFFGTRIESLSWLGRRYKHDFIVLPPLEQPYDPPRKYHDKLFDGAFPCMVVNLDTIHRSPDVVKQLVDKKIIDPALLTKNISLSPKKQMSVEEGAVVTEIHQWLQKPGIQGTLGRNLLFAVQRIDVGVFEASGEECAVLAALFDDKGKLLEATPEEIRKRPPLEKVCIGLNVASALFKRVAASKNPNRSFYLMGLIAHEIVCTQKLIPHSAKFYYVRNGLERDVIGALQHELLYEGKERLGHASATVQS